MITNGSSLEPTFGTADYTLYIMALGLFVAIGIYFGYFAKVDNTTTQYLFAGKQMKVIPIAISMIASQISGLAIVNAPAEVYSFGITYVFTVVALIVAIPIMCYIIYPVFYENNFVNCYEYLEHRFNKLTRQVVTTIFMITVFLGQPVMSFIPSLALSQVTGINVHLINGVIWFVCVFYTMLGGIKAVVWTDVLQGSIIFLAVVTVCVMGVIDVGGVGNVLDTAVKGGRLHVSLELDPRIRTTFWNCFFFGVSLWVGFVGCSQVCVQRVMTLPTLSHARRSLVLYGIGHLFVVVVTCFTGIIMYSKYSDCDPIATRVVQKPDKMIPFFVQDVIGHWKGMSGIFNSCICSATLSTMSASLNALAGVFYFDCIKPFIKHSESKANFIMKIFVVCIGVLGVAGGYIVEGFTSFVQVIATIAGTTYGIMFGLFMLGLLVPKANGRAAVISLIISLSSVAILVIGAHHKIRTGHLKYVPLPTSIEGCPELASNSTVQISHTSFMDERSFDIFDVSFNIYATFGAILIWIVAVPLSYIFPLKDPVNPKYLASFIRPSPTISTLPEELPLNMNSD